MKRIRLFALLSVATIGLSACMSGSGTDSRDGIFQITHSTKGSVYWE